MPIAAAITASQLIPPERMFPSPILLRGHNNSGGRAVHRCEKLTLAAADPAALAIAPDIAVIDVAAAPCLDDRFAPHPVRIGEQQPQLRPFEPPLRRLDGNVAAIVAEPRRVLEQRSAGDVPEADRDLDRPRTGGAADEPAGRMRRGGEREHRADEEECASHPVKLPPAA